MIQDISNINLSVLKSDLNNLSSSNPKQEDIVDKPEKKIILKENAYVKAIKFVISALLHKKDYISAVDIADYVLNTDYIKILNYIDEENKNGKTPIVSKLFDLFDVENNRDIYDIVNYEFANGEDNKQYFDDCINLITKSGLAMQKEKLLSELSQAKESAEKSELIKQLQEIVMKEKRK